MTSVTIGQYYPIKSTIHNIDPRIKILSIIDFIIMLFVADNIIGYAFATILMLIIVKKSKVPFLMLLKGLRPILFLICFTFILNILFTKGDNLLISFWIINIYAEGIIFAFMMAYRLILIIFASSILTLTTTPIKLTDSIEKLLNPLKVIKVPAHEIAMIMTIALRFIPILMEELNFIMKAQTSRGATFDQGNIIKRIKSLIPILVPLFVSAFRRADDLAMAMEARCYRGDINRTRMNKLEFGKIDMQATIMIILATIIFIFIGLL